MTTPMNIASNSIDNYCDEKCAYSFKYKSYINCNAKNYGTSLYLSYIDSSPVPPVTFNSINYRVSSIEMYSPSLHYFNGKQTDGELIITHTPTGAGKNLVVCIPMSVSGQQTPASQVVTDIINSAVNKPLNQGDPEMNITVNNTLDSVVPMKPFFYYQGGDGTNIIVYGLSDSIGISDVTINDLRKLIPIPPTILFPSGAYVDLNKNGPTVGNGDSEIFIDCQPTGNSEVVEQVTFAKNQVNNDISSNTLIQYIVYAIGVIIMAAILYGIYRLIQSASITTKKSFESAVKPRNIFPRNQR